MAKLPKFSAFLKKEAFWQNDFNPNGNTGFETSKIWRGKHEIHNSNGLCGSTDRDASFRLPDKRPK